LTAGDALVRWYYLPAGAHLTKGKPKAVLVASGKHAFSAAGTAKLTIRLTPDGRRLLKHAKRLNITAKGSFTPSGAGAVTASKHVTLSP
jgi:hypothetical protein